MHNREHIVAIRPDGKELKLHAMFSADEVQRVDLNASPFKARIGCGCELLVPTYAILKMRGFSVALKAYFDDSGTDPGNPSLVVAGFASTEEQWDRFSDEWLGVQEKFEAPPFHAKEFDDARRGFGPYTDWPKSKREEYLKKLLAIIARRTHKSFGTALEKAAYESLIGSQLAFREYFYAPFAFSSVNCVFQVCDWRNDLYAGEPIQLCFDEGNKNIGQLLSVAKNVLIGSDRMVEDVRQEDDKRTPPLQAADLLAFEMCVEARAVLRNSYRYSRYPLQRLDELPHEWLEVNHDNLQARIDELFGDGTFSLVANATGR
jgi:hypothetical protein